MTVLDVQNATITYGDFVAVDHVTFGLEEGRTLGLLGTNGAGKTSLLEACEGMRKPSSGTIRVFGKDPFRCRNEIAHKTGVVFQRADFPKILRGREILQLWHKLSRTSETVDGLIGGLGLSRFVDKPIKQLSGGERRRLDLACALISKPNLLFLDEPTTGLDPEVRASTWEIVKSVQDEGVTIVLTTHYLEEVEELAQDIVLLHQGSLRLSGTLEDILSSMLQCFSLRLPAGVLLPDTLGVEPEYRGNGEVRIWTENIQEDSRAVLQWLSARGIDVSDSYKEHPVNLRSIFLKIASA